MMCSAGDRIRSMAEHGVLDAVPGKNNQGVILFGEQSQCLFHQLFK